MAGCCQACNLGVMSDRKREIDEASVQVEVVAREVLADLAITNVSEKLLRQVSRGSAGSLVDGQLDWLDLRRTLSKGLEKLSNSIETDALRKRLHAERRNRQVLASGSVARIALIVSQMAELEQERDDQVVLARLSGASWAVIAEALGVKPQSAHQKYSKIIDGLEQTEIGGSDASDGVVVNDAGADASKVRRA